MLGHCSLMIMYLYSKSVIYLSECVILQKITRSMDALHITENFAKWMTGIFVKLNLRLIDMHNCPQSPKSIDVSYFPFGKACKNTLVKPSALTVCACCPHAFYYKILGCTKIVNYWIREQMYVFKQPVNFYFNLSFAEFDLFFDGPHCVTEYVTMNGVSNYTFCGKKESWDMVWPENKVLQFHEFNI